MTDSLPERPEQQELQRCISKWRRADYKMWHRNDMWIMLEDFTKAADALLRALPPAPTTTQFMMAGQQDVEKAAGVGPQPLEVMPPEPKAAADHGRPESGLPVDSPAAPPVGDATPPLTDEQAGSIGRYGVTPEVVERIKAACDNLNGVIHTIESAGKVSAADMRFEVNL